MLAGERSYPYITLTDKQSSIKAGRPLPLQPRMHCEKGHICLTNQISQMNPGNQNGVTNVIVTLPSYPKVYILLNI